ncbi:MAG: hypothetical protein GC147_06005 [Porphyrobacter sp.]|nr:hypothetical protein [Porphyrobacter sp.]
MSETRAPGARAAPDIRVWDPLLRLSHWSFALLVPILWWTAENKVWAWHRRLGLVLLGILVFRILWGFVGTRTALFADFVKGPGTVLAYLRGALPGAATRIGHSPLAGWSTLALLAAMLVQVGMGLFAGDPFDGMTGPLNPLVGVMTADTLTEWHETFFYVVAGLAVLHLAAIVYYASFKGQDLVSPMLSGERPASEGVEGNGPMPWLRGLAAVAVAAGFAWWITLGAPPLT